LSDDHKRFRYDKALGQEISEEVDRILDGPSPVITSFFTSKKTCKKGDLLTISWEVLNAEDVHINMIGDVATNGTQTIRLVDEAIAQEFLILEISANNKTSNTTSSKKLELKNLDFSSKQGVLIGKHKALSQKNGNTETTEKDSRSKNRSTTKKIKPKTNKPVTQSVEKDKKQDYNRHRRKDSSIAFVLVVLMIFIIMVMLYTIHSINPMF
jgi:cobalamin biosynthesis Mg chelatase CobN